VDITLPMLCSAYSPLLGASTSTVRPACSSLPSASPIPPSDREGKKEKLGRHSLSPDMGYDLPLPDPFGDLVVHEVVSPHDPGIHVHGAVGDGDGEMPGWER
jgi:hypothetical protein